MAFLATRNSVRYLSNSNSNSNHNESNDTESNKHQKSYHVKGTSTSPTPTSWKNEEKPGRSSKRRRGGCGPGVTINTVNTHHALQTDLPKPMGGTNLAPQPVETLLAAWIGCTQATALFVSRQLRVVVIDKMEFDVTAFRDERGALQLPIEVTPDVSSRLQEIRGTIHVHYTMTSSTDMDQELLSDDQLELLKEQTEARCPVANMIIESGCRMNVEWIAHKTEEQE